MFEKYLLKNDIHYFPTMELWSIEAIKQTVMSGLGFSVLPYITVKDEVESGKLKILPHSQYLDPLYSQMLIKRKRGSCLLWMLLRIWYCIRFVNLD